MRNRIPFFVIFSLVIGSKILMGKKFNLLEKLESPPKVVGFSPDDTKFAYLKERKLYLVDMDRGKEKVVALPEDIHYSSIVWLDSSGIVSLNSSKNKIVKIGIEDLKTEVLLSLDTPIRDLRISPKRKYLSFSSDGDFFLLGLKNKDIIRVTYNGNDPFVINGYPDWVYWEEIWGRRSIGVWWNRDDTAVAFYRIDNSKTKGVYWNRYNDLPYPNHFYQPYPKAGENNPKVEVFVYWIPKDQLVKLQVDDEYIAPLGWVKDLFWVASINRDQTRVRLFRCFPEGNCDIVFKEEHSTWVNFNSDFYSWKNYIVWSDEQSGYRRIIKLKEDGSHRYITPADIVVTSIIGVDTKGRVYFQGFNRKPLLSAINRYIWRVDLESGDYEKVFDSKGWSSGLLSNYGRFFYYTFSTSDSPPERSVVDLESGRVIYTFPVSKMVKELKDLPNWRFFTIESGKKRFPAAILYPKDYSGSKKYPAIMYHYGGPGSQVVANRWDYRGRGLWHKWMALNGFFVLMVDNEASIFFGKKGEDLQYRRFGPINLRAQLAGIKYLGKLGVDTERVGLWGWSGGGSNTLYCVLNAPGKWKAAVAGAPVTDWRLYDTIWTERYLDLPQVNEEGYKASSPISYVENLSDKLMIVHGTYDDNVHPQNSYIFVKKLIDLGKDFVFVVYPDQKHGLSAKYAEDFFNRMSNFFFTHLTYDR